MGEGFLVIPQIDIPDLDDSPRKVLLPLSSEWGMEREGELGLVYNVKSKFLK